jgi:hypothetical protein
LPSQYLETGDHYPRYQVNISSSGCQAGAEVTIRQAMAGTGGATITQAVTVPGFNTATFVLPAAAARPTAPPLATPTPQPTVTRPVTAAAVPLDLAADDPPAGVGDDGQECAAAAWTGQ